MVYSCRNILSNNNIILTCVLSFNKQQQIPTTHNYLEPEKFHFYPDPIKLHPKNEIHGAVIRFLGDRQVGLTLAN
jgi:hypothetical protein